MNSLTTNPVADVLARLYRESEAADRPLFEQFIKESDDFDIGQFLKDEAKDYKAVYKGYANNFLNVSQEFGQFLYTCIRNTKAKRVVEFGSSMGISTIHMAAALRDNGGGKIIGTELEESKAKRARKNIAAAGLSEIVEIRVGDALETLKDVEGPIDVLMLDGAFTLYLRVLKLLEPNFRNGTLIIGENAIKESSDYLDYVRNPKNGYLSLPLPFDEGRGNELTLFTL
jgi:predicted O-methyltransferase YrrM